ncbi:PDZ domain-containing protein [Lacibacter sp. H375]|uniref:PDZ domain-containing protein n=1 Tax=Lacibacter sp. H375 TaxID=3133424 RepID=UPI0030C4A54E
MKRISVYACAFVAATQLLTLSASAQDKKEKREKEEKKEQIIIRKKGDKTEKTTIVIEGDKVTVNGKPVEKGDKDIIIHRFDGDDEFVFRSPKVRVTAPRGAYRFQHDGNWEQFNGDHFLKEFEMNWKSAAFLGVVTEDHDKGALVEEVQKETPAEKAGLQKGDIITKVGDKKIGSPSDLSEAVHAKKPNDEVEITYLRDGREKKAKAKLGESKGPEGMHNFNFKMPDMHFGDGQFNFEHLQPRLHGLQDQIRIYQGGRPKFGATIQDTEEGNGVKVLEVEADSPSAKSGLQKDDVITEVNGKAVKNVAEAREALRANNEQNLWTVKVLRAGKPVTVEVKIPKKLNKADL